MSDTVFDATVVAYTNEGILDPSKLDGAKEGIEIISTFVAGSNNLRYNSRLEREWREHTRNQSDLIKIFYTILDSARAIRVKTNTLRSHQVQSARKCNWPGHDDHLLAAAIDGHEPMMYVTEHRQHTCSQKIYRTFRIRIRQVIFAR